MKDSEETPVFELEMGHAPAEERMRIWAYCDQCNSCAPIYATPEGVSEAFVHGWRSVKVAGRRRRDVLCPDCSEKCRTSMHVDVDPRGPCTLENCGHMRQLDAIVDFLGMPRGGCSVLDWLRSRANERVTVKAFIERVELTRQKYGSANVAKAFLVFADDADNHEFKVAVPRDFAQKIGAYLETWDDSYEAPKISITFSVENDGE